LYISLDITYVSKSISIRWAGHVGRMAEIIYREYWSDNLKGRDHSEGADGRIILECILGK